MPAGAGSGLRLTMCGEWRLSQDHGTHRISSFIRRPPLSIPAGAAAHVLYILRSSSLTDGLQVLLGQCRTAEIRRHAGSCLVSEGCPEVRRDVESGCGSGFCCGVNVDDDGGIHLKYASTNPP